MAAAFALVMVQQKFPAACRWSLNFAGHFAQPTRCRDMSMVTGEQGPQQREMSCAVATKPFGWRDGMEVRAVQVWYLLQFLKMDSEYPKYPG